MFLALRGAFASLLVDSRQYRRRLLQINPALKTPAEIDGQLGSSEGLEVLDDGPVQLQLAERRLVGDHRVRRQRGGSQVNLRSA